MNTTLKTTTTIRTTTQNASTTVSAAGLENMRRLRMEIYLFIMCATIFWLICMGLVYRHHRALTKKRRKDDISLVIPDEEGGDAQYVISFFTGEYSQPPSGKVVLHLIGSLFPGKFHTLQDPSHPTSLFPPLSREKFVVAEDVGLGRIIAIVIQTECNGDNPAWVCQTVIVRDVRTSEAWYFKVEDEVCFPPMTVLSATEDELTCFKRSFHRRIRREVRQGQYIYFGFWFRTSRSVYTLCQRIVTAFICHFFLLSLSLVFLGLAFPPEADDVETPSSAPFSYEVKSIQFLAGKDGKMNWVYHALTIASMVSVLTSCVGYFMVALFRQRKKYENQLEEMDYVIGTALHEHNMKKKQDGIVVHQSGPRKSRTPSSALPGALDSMESQEDTEKSKNENVLEDFVANLANEENQFEMTPREMMVQEDAGDSNPIVIVTEPQLTEKPHEGWGAKFQGFFGKKPDHEPPSPITQDPPGALQTALSVPGNVIKKLNPFAVRNSEKERKPAPAPNALERRGGKSFSVKTPPSSRSSKSSIQPGGTREMLDQIEELNLRLGSGMMTPSTSSMPHVYYPGGFSEKAARFPYHLLGKTPFEKRAYMRQLFYVDVNFNPVEFSAKIQSAKTQHMSDTDAGGSWFGTPVPITRKCYQPVLAWIFVFIMIGASTAGIILTIIFGSVQLHRGGEHEFFYLILSATIMISLLMGAFVVETIKICLIGLVFALLDKGMYKRITHRGIKEVK